jgi:hypothetical protein
MSLIAHRTPRYCRYATQAGVRCRTQPSDDGEMTCPVTMLARRAEPVAVAGPEARAEGTRSTSGAKPARHQAPGVADEPACGADRFPVEKEYNRSWLPTQRE